MLPIVLVSPWEHYIGSLIFCEYLLHIDYGLKSTWLSAGYSAVTISWGV